MKAGLSVDYADKDDDSMTAKAWNDDAGASFRIRTTFNYAADWGGAKIRLQSTGGDFGAPRVYGWGNFLGSKIVVHGGKGIDDLWGLGKLSENVFDPSVDGVDGVRIAFNLLPGLSFGYALPVKVDAQPIGDVFGSSVFGGLYKSSIFTAALSVALNPATDAEVTPVVPAYDPWTRILIGVEVNPVDIFKIIVDADIDTRKNDDHGKTGYIRIAPHVQYSGGPITAHARGDILIQNDDKGVVDYDTNMVLTEETTYVNYVPVEKVGDTSIAFRVGGAYQFNDTANAYLQLGSDNVSFFDGNGLYVKLGTVINLGPSAIEIFDKVNRIGADDFGGNSPLTNQFQIDFAWKF
ncbi:MAG: hypothetical protein LBL31_03250 [Spirochaetaceae bacterium]|nr:hypothetical protein [Spirochaetaceae bacterium]